MSITLTPRQMQVLELGSRGYSAQETAVELGIGIETVRTHRKLLLRALGARTVAEAVARAYERWIL